MAATYRVPGAILTEREHAVPLDHERPDGPTLTVFTREVSPPDGDGKPYLVFLQGGPGFEATLHETRWPRVRRITPRHPKNFRAMYY